MSFEKWVELINFWKALRLLIFYLDRNVQVLSHIIQLLCIDYNLTLFNLFKCCGLFLQFLLSWFGNLARFSRLFLGEIGSRLMLRRFLSKFGELILESDYFVLEGSHLTLKICDFLCVRHFATWGRRWGSLLKMRKMMSNNLWSLKWETRALMGIHNLETIWCLYTIFLPFSWLG